MFKKSIASFLMLAMVFGVSLTLSAQESENYNMWEDIMLTPDFTKLKILETNMRKHNQTYHKSGPFEAAVYNIVSGPNSGNIIWEMGPMMYKHNDTRPDSGGHDEDWRDNVMPYIKKMHTKDKLAAIADNILRFIFISTFTSTFISTFNINEHL